VDEVNPLLYLKNKHGVKGRNTARREAIIKQETASPTPGAIVRRSQDYGRMKLEILRSMQWQFAVRAIRRPAMRPYFYAETHAGPGLIEFGDGPATERHPGSTLQAAITEPFFDELLFIERDPQFAASLNAVYARHKAWGDQKATIKAADSNLVGVAEVQALATRTRAGMVFVDPEGLDYTYGLLAGLSTIPQVFEIMLLFPYEMAIARTWQQNPETILRMFSPQRQSTIRETLDRRQREQTLTRENAVDLVTQALVQDLHDLGWSKSTVTETFRNERGARMYNLVHATRNEISRKIFTAVAPARTTHRTLGDF
jgi:three-Cys-motif partner protein